MTVDLLSRAEEAAALLSGMANARRLHILCLLMEGEHSVGVLAEKVALSQSALSQHLAKLRNLGIVATRRQGQTIYYSMASHAVRDLVIKLDGLFQKAEAYAKAS